MSKEKQENNIQDADVYDGNKVTIKLNVPLKRGNQSIERITVYKPSAGNLRGTNLNDILHQDVQTLQRILPRITEPVLHANDFDELDLSDFMNLGLAVTTFFAEPLIRKDAQKEMAAK